MWGGSSCFARMTHGGNERITPGVPLSEFVLTKLRTSPGAPAMEFALTKLRTSPGAPELPSVARKFGVGYPVPPGWNLLWKRENFTRGPRAGVCAHEAEKRARGPRIIE